MLPPNWLPLLCAFWLGAIIGAFAVAMCNVAASNDQHEGAVTISASPNCKAPTRKAGTFFYSK